MPTSKTAEYEITVKIRVAVNDPHGCYDDPKMIAEEYAQMATKYKSIGAISAEVVEIKKANR